MGHVGRAFPFPEPPSRIMNTRNWKFEGEKTHAHQLGHCPLSFKGNVWRSIGDIRHY